MARLSVEEQLALWRELYELQDIFPNTTEGLLNFADICIQELIPGRPRLNRVQADILTYMFEGKQFRMVQAGRGIAKTTLAGIYCVFRLIHAPAVRVVVFSQTGKRAREIAGWVIKIFSNLDFLAFMLPDRNSGDKSSNSEGYDVNGVLKGSQKEPSVSCYSIESGAQGARGDIILADDIESLQNSRTAQGREWLEDQSREFTSINQFGDIIYLGTPQSTDSIYNNLPGRGFDVRIWPARYPTKAEIDTYGGFLAPMLAADLEKNPELGEPKWGLTGKRGMPTAPEMFDEDQLTLKEMDQTSVKFDLQFMLNTRLSDADKYPLRISDLVFAPMTLEKGPSMPIWSAHEACIIKNAPRPGNKPSDQFRRMYPGEYEWLPWSRKFAYIDPSGGGANGDEMSLSIVFVLGNFVYLWDCIGFKGGYARPELVKVVHACRDAGVREVMVEDNYGNGALKAAIAPVFVEEGWPVSLEGDWSKGQKELRIIDALEPLMNTHRVVVNENLIDKDHQSIQKYEAGIRKVFSLFHQMSHITRVKGCLTHDDRVESFASAVARVMERIQFSQTAAEAAERLQELRDWAKAVTTRDGFQKLFQRGSVASTGPRRSACDRLEGL